MSDQVKPESSPQVVDELRLKRCVAVAIYEAVSTSRAPAAQGWRSGPLPLRMNGDEVTDTRWRAQFVHARVQGPLYHAERRAHWTPADAEPPMIPGTLLEVTGAEVLRFRAGPKDRPNAILAVHMAPGSEGKAMIGELRSVTRELDTAPARRLLTFLESLLPEGIRISTRPRNATLLLFATHEPDSALLGKSSWARGEPTSWAVRDTWRWSLAMASPPSLSRLASPQEPTTPGRLVAMPRRDVQVLDRGVAIMGTRKDTRSEEAAEYEKDEIRSRTLFLDALLLGIVQRILVEQLADDAAHCGDPARNQGKLREVQRDVRVFRNLYWWQEFSIWDWPDRILRAYQAEHGVVHQVDRLVAEMSAYASEVSNANSERTTLGLALVALIGVPGVVATTLSALQTDPDVAEDWLWASGALVSFPALLVIILILRSYLGRRRGDRVEG